MMRKSVIHDCVLLNPLDEHFQALGFECWREYSTHRFGISGFIDLFVEHDTCRIAVEGERSPDRVFNDISKAISVRAECLIIVTPTLRVAKAIQRKLSRAEPPSESLEILVLPLGQARNWVTNRFPLNSDLIIREKKSEKNSRE